MYHGIIYQEDPPASLLRQLVGTMGDHYGSSRLTNVVYNPDHSLVFTKQYDHRRDTINYEFKRNENGLWLGTYTGTAVGNGISACVLTEVNPLMFDPSKVAEMVMQPAAHS